MNAMADVDRSKLTPDFRCWGGGSFTGQNQRLVYWPMIKSGDYDMMAAQFDFYLRALPGAEARTKAYWGHEGACFTEQLENFGLPFGWGYGWSGADANHIRTKNLEPGVQAGKFIRYHYDSQIEFAFMIFEYQRYSQRSIKKWLPFIRSAIQFFDEHYRFRSLQETGQEFDQLGHYRFSSSTSLETYKNAKNPLPVIAGLKVLLEAAIACNDSAIDSDDKSHWQTMLSKLPGIPTRHSADHTIFSPAEEYDPERVNMEDPQLYAVYPYPIVQKDNEWWQIAQDTWDFDDIKYRFKVCWGQTAIWAAKLHRLEEAKKEIIAKMQNADRRFPAFWGPGPDWVPDVDHGGAGMIALQEMLTQCDKDHIDVLPTWPKDWDVEVKLRIPQDRYIELTVKDGQLTHLQITPHSPSIKININPIFEQ